MPLSEDSTPSAAYADRTVKPVEPEQPKDKRSTKEIMEDTLSKYAEIQSMLQTLDTDIDTDGQDLYMFNTDLSRYRMSQRIMVHTNRLKMYAQCSSRGLSQYHRDMNIDANRALFLLDNFDYFVKNEHKCDSTCKMFF